MIIRKTILAVSILGLGGISLSGCDDVSGSAHVGVYYDSMMWNDYYRPHPPARPPARPVHPIAPAPPVRPTPPIHRPRPMPR